jgi:hypothetical protein
LLKHDARRPDPSGMPYLLALGTASAAGWLSDVVIRPVAGVAGSMVLSLVLSSIVFLHAKRYFEELRGGR